MLMSSGMWLAPIYFFLYIAFRRIGSPEIWASFIFEMTILALWLRLISKLLKCVNKERKAFEIQKLIQILKFGIGIEIAIACFLFSQDGIGLFSEGSKIEYLSDSRLNLYLTYMSLLISVTLVPVAAAILRFKMQWDKWVVGYILLHLVLSILSGSKGGGLILLVGFLCLLRFPNYAVYFRLLRYPLILGVAFVASTIYFVGDFLKLTSSEMMSLMFSRFFLVNDGRALAIDLANTLNNENISLFQESFRAISSAIGSPPLNIPLGQLLYQEAFSTMGMLGANTSSAALLIAYGDALEKTGFFLVLFVCAVFIYLLASKEGKFKMIRLTIGGSLLNLLSQDFLAFQVIVNLLIAGILAIIIFKIVMRIIRLSVVKSMLYNNIY